MATAKEMLMQELQRRQAQEQQDQNAIRGDIKSQRAMAEIDPIHRRNLGPTAQLMDDFYGGNMAKQEAASRPESTEIALRRAFQAQANTPKQNLLGYLQGQIGQENAQLKAANVGNTPADKMRIDKESQRMREAAAKSKEGQAIIKDRSLQRAVGDYKTLVNEHGFQVTGPKRAEIDRAYRDLQIAYKNAAELGVIAGPDMMLIEGVAPPSTGFGSFFQSRIKGGLDGVNKALDGLTQSRQDNIDDNSKILNSVFQAPSTQGTLQTLGGGGAYQPAQPQEPQKERVAKTQNNFDDENAWSTEELEAAVREQKKGF